MISRVIVTGTMDDGKKKCKACFERIPEEEFDQHLANEHGTGPLAPRPVCPPELEFLREPLIESRYPEWVTATAPVKKELASRVKPMLREFAEVDTDHYLSTIWDMGYDIVKRETP